MKKFAFILVIIMLALCLFACNKTIVDNKDPNPISYSINMTLDNDVLSAQQTTTISNKYADSLDKVTFNLYANAYAENAKYKAYDGKLPAYGGIKINAVTKDNTPMEFSLSPDNNFLYVSTPEFKKNTSLALKIDYKVTLPKCNLRMGITDTAIKLSSFYPQLACYGENGFREDNFTMVGDPFFSESSNYDVTIQAPSDLVIASSGTVIKKENPTDKTQLVQFKAENIRDFALVADKKFVLSETTYNNTAIKYYHYGDKTCDKTLKIITDSLKTFSEMYGEYTYPSLSVVMTDFCDGGMEYGRLVYIANKNIDFEDTIAHEIAHQWWYSLVGSDAINNPYIDEGLATFSALLYFKKIHGDAEYTTRLNALSESYTLYEKLQKMRQTGVNLAINKSIYEYTDYQYEMLAYRKSAMMFAHIFQTMGEQKFSKAMKNYVQKQKFLIANSDDLIAELNSAYGNDIGGVFKGWLLNGNVTKQ